MIARPVECPSSPSGNHSWCPCFGACACNRAECTMCDATRPLTDEEIAAKSASASAVQEETT